MRQKLKLEKPDIIIKVILELSVTIVVQTNSEIKLFILYAMSCHNCCLVNLPTLHFQFDYIKN
jgi:hypothetical protein